MSELVMPDDGMSDEELARGFWAAITVSAEGFRVAAEFWVKMEARGTDMSPFRFGLGKYFRGIVAGTILPEVVSTYQGTSLLSKVAYLSLPEQKRLAKPTATVEVAVKLGNGEFDKQMLAVIDLSRGLIAQVFDTADGRVRSRDEQIALLRKPQPLVRPSQLKYEQISLSKDLKTFFLGGKSIPTEKVRKLFREAGVQGW